MTGGLTAAKNRGSNGHHLYESEIEREGGTVKQWMMVWHYLGVGVRGVDSSNGSCRKGGLAVRKGRKTGNGRVGWERKVRESAENMAADADHIYIPSNRKEGRDQP